MVEYLLVLVLQFDIGWPDKLWIVGDKWNTLDVCMAEGARTANWLEQDFVTVNYYCIEDK